jgi:hypothetical protein
MTRSTTEGCMSIDIRSWDREGRLRAGQCFLHHLTWNWEPTQGIGVLTKADAVYVNMPAQDIARAHRVVPDR